MHCMRCKTKTGTVDGFLEAKNGRYRLAGKCQECGRGKSQFVGAGFFSSIGKGAFKRIANFIRTDSPNVRRLQLGEFHFGNHNFTGPGTKIAQPAVKAFTPFNNIDACSRTHDLAFSRAFKLKGKKRLAAIRKADKKAVQCYSMYPREHGFNAAMTGINSKMGIEDISPAFAKLLLGDLIGSK